MVHAGGSRLLLELAVPRPDPRPPRPRRPASHSHDRPGGARACRGGTWAHRHRQNNLPARAGDRPRRHRRRRLQRRPSLPRRVKRANPAAAFSRKASTQRRKIMYALQISRFGEPSDVLELVKLPDPHDPLANEVLVAMEYAPINNSDLLTIRGQYGRLPSLPTGIGFEGIGRILSVGGEVDDLKVGDRVLLPSSSYSWREKIRLPSTGLFPLPQNSDPQQLSMLSINPPTAALLLSEYVALN